MKNTFFSFFSRKTFNLSFLSLFVLLFITLIPQNLLSQSDNLKNAPAFNPNEDCSTSVKEIQVAKEAAQIACKWIEEIGAGDKNDPQTAFGKIFRYRFCQDNYVWILEWVDNVTSTSHAPYKIMLLHPTKPALEDNLNLVHLDFGRGYHVIEQQLMTGKVQPQGCWIPYYWTKPGTEKATQKISFIMRCKDKLSGKYMTAGAGIYGDHNIIRKLNPAECKPAEQPIPFK